MKQTITLHFPQIIRNCSVALGLIVWLPTTPKIFGQCQGFGVTITAPQTYTYCAEDSITVTSEVSGGTHPYTYAWSTGGTGPTETVLPLLNGWFPMTLTVTDANGCVAFSNTIHIKAIFAHITINYATGPQCESEGLKLLVEPISFGDATFLWSTGETTNPITVYASGPYTVTVTSSLSCTIELGLNAQLLPSPIPTVTGPTNLCESGDDAELNVLGGPFTNIQWLPNGGNAPELTVNGPGEYSVLVTYANGCDAIGTIEIPPFPTIPPILEAPIYCPFNSGPVGVVNAQDYVAFHWSSGAYTSSAMGFAGNTYQVTVTDANGCTETGSTYVDEMYVSYPSVVGYSEICEGQDTVDLFILPFFEFYQWSTSETTQTISVTEADHFFVTVTDVNGCTTTGDFILKAAPIPEPSVLPAIISCSGDPAELTVNGGPYSTYEWSNGATDSTILVSQPGSYTVTVSNASGCKADTSSTVTSAQGFMANILPSPYDCSGSVTLVGAGGSSYEWSNGDTTSAITVQTSGTYTVTVTDAAGCTDLVEETVDLPLLPQVSISGTNAICIGDSGNFVASSGFDQYLWSGGETTAEITVSQPGTYTVTVTDSNGCTVSTSQSFTALPPPEPEINGPVGFCENATATLQLNQPFSQVVWSNGSGSQNITVSQPGIYTVSVTDAAGCTGTSQMAITASMPPAVDISGPSSICSGTVATLAVADNFSQINWSTGETGSSISAASAGNYAVTVVDANGCSNTDTQELEIGTSLTPGIVVASTSCEGDVTLDAGGGFDTYLWSNGSTGQQLTVSSDGVYSVTVSNGTGCTGEIAEAVTIPTPTTIGISGPASVCEGETAILTADLWYVSYIWSNGEIAPSISVSQPGSYTVIASDSNGCTFEASLVFENSPQPSPAISGPSSICTGSNAGLSVSGNFSQVNWNTGETTTNINVSQTGTYTVTVTDANGCTNEATQEVEAGDSLNPTIVSVGDNCSGESTLSAGNGYGSYQWSNGATTPTITVDNEGSYSVTVSDVSGCSGEGVVQVSLPTQLQVGISGQTMACENEAVVLAASPGFASYEWSDGQTAGSITVSGTGIYEVTATDANGCTATASHPFDYFTGPNVSISGPPLVCFGETAQLSVSGNFTNLIWSNGATTDSITVSQAGTYSVVVIDANGCTKETSQELLVTDPIYPIITATNEPCDSTSTLDAGMGYSSYLWSNGSTDPVMDVTANGLYAVTVTDANGCTESTSINVVMPSAPVTNISGASTLCDGDTTILVASAGFDEYIWSTGEISASISVSQGGNYSVTATDANGCTASNEWVLVLHQTDHIFLQEEACSALDTGMVEEVLTNQFGCDSVVVTNTVLAPSLTSAIELSACEGAFAEFDGIQIRAGSEQTFVYNSSSGCDSIVLVSVAALPSVMFDLSATTTCWNESDGMIEVSIHNGTAPYQYVLNGGFSQQAPVFSGLPSGQYSVLVNDANGCELEQNIGIVQTEPLQVLVEDVELPCGEGPVTLHPSVLSGVSSTINWEWGDGSSSPWLLVDAPGDYQLLVSDGCGEQELTVHVTLTSGETDGELFYIPNSFSPNYDGINDDFRVFPSRDIDVKSFEFLVFDRWGDMMFSTGDVGTGWDGVHKGIQKQPAVYVWYVKAKVELCGGREVDFYREGGVTIIR